MSTAAGLSQVGAAFWFPGKDRDAAWKSHPGTADYTALASSKVKDPRDTDRH